MHGCPICLSLRVPPHLAFIGCVDPHNGIIFRGCVYPHNWIIFRGCMYPHNWIIFRGCGIHMIQGDFNVGVWIYGFFCTEAERFYKCISKYGRQWSESWWRSPINQDPVSCWPTEILCHADPLTKILYHALSVCVFLYNTVCRLFLIGLCSTRV